jgi:hypothetical protein
MADNAHGFDVKEMKKLAKHDPPRTLNIPARPLYFIYYSAQPMS